MEEIIKQLEEKKEILHRELAIKIDKIDKVIDDLKDIDYGDAEKREEEARENLLKTEQKIKPINIDPKLLKKKEIKFLEKEEKKVSITSFPYPKPSTKIGLRTKFPVEMEGFVKSNLNLGYEDLTEKVNKKFGLEMDSKNMSDYLRYRKIKGIVKKKLTVHKYPKKRINTQKKYPEEMVDFIKKNIETNSSKELVELINKEFGVGITLTKLAAYMSYKRLKRDPKSREYRSRKYSKEAIQFLKENINNFTNKEICKDLDLRFHIKTNIGNLANFLSANNIKRDIQTDMDPEIVDFIKKSKVTDVYTLRDNIIDKFEKNIQTEELRKIMKERQLPGEDSNEELKRVVNKRTEEDYEDDDSIDDLELD